MSILEIITYPHPTLDLQAQDVQFPLTAQDKTLISDMWQTVEDKGVGLAAPQVNVSKKICIIGLDPEMIPKNQKIKNNFVMINPEITFFSQVKSNIIEGCLSFPEQYYKIIRPSNIIVKFFNEKGKVEIIKANGWLSRVIQHEIDHLNGQLFINMGGQKLERDDIKDKRDIVD
jgi:peptide deformylase